MIRQSRPNGYPPKGSDRLKLGFLGSRAFPNERWRFDATGSEGTRGHGQFHVKHPGGAGSVVTRWVTLSTRSRQPAHVLPSEEMHRVLDSCARRQIENLHGRLNCESRTGQAPAGHFNDRDRRRLANGRPEVPTGEGIAAHSAGQAGRESCLGPLTPGSELGNEGSPPQ